MSGSYQPIPGGDEGPEEAVIAGVELVHPSYFALSQRHDPPSHSSGNLSPLTDSREEMLNPSSTLFDRSLLLSHSLPIRGAPPSAPSKLTTACIWCGCFVIVLLLMGALMSIFKFTVELQTQVIELSGKLRTLDSELVALRIESRQGSGSVLNDVVRIERNYTRSVTAIDGRLVAIDSTLARLTNHTTNAEVLDRLAQSRQEIHQELQQTKFDVGLAIDASARNVSRTLRENQLKMQQTETRLRDVVKQAKTEIHGVQSNVTQQLAAMSRALEDTVVGVKETVDAAQVTIHSEVQLVQDNIEQYVAITNKQFAAEDDFVKYQLAGTFTMLGCLISGYHLTAHLRHYHKPDVQRRIMAVLWMVPIYGITSWLSLVVPKFESIFGALRDCYEAYAVYTFIALLIAILEDGRGLQHLLTTLTEHIVEERNAVEEAVRNRQPRPPEHLRPPFPCCYEWHKPSQVAKAWLYQCRLMAMQFVMTKPFFSLVPLICWLAGFDYDSHPPFVHREIDWKSPKLYIIFLQNLSVAVAFYGLLSFYHGTEKDLAWCDPWPKFLCIKGVVFMTFWQGLTLQSMGSLGFVTERQAAQIQNLLICIEMLLASLAHFYIFPYQEWEEGYKREKEKSVLLRDTLALRDFVTDMKMMVTRWESGPAEGVGGGGGGGGGAGGEGAGPADEGVADAGRGETFEEGEEEYQDRPSNLQVKEGAALGSAAAHTLLHISNDTGAGAVRLLSIFPESLALAATPPPSLSPTPSPSPASMLLPFHTGYQATWADRGDKSPRATASSSLSDSATDSFVPFHSSTAGRHTSRSSFGSLVGRPETVIDADIEDLVGLAMESIGQAVTQLERRSTVGAAHGSSDLGGGILHPSRKARKRDSSGAAASATGSGAVRLSQAEVEAEVEVEVELQQRQEQEQQWRDSGGSDLFAPTDAFEEEDKQGHLQDEEQLQEQQQDLTWSTHGSPPREEV